MYNYNLNIKTNRGQKVYYHYIWSKLNQNSIYITNIIIYFAQYGGFKNEFYCDIGFVDLQVTLV